MSAKGLPIYCLIVERLVLALVGVLQREPTSQAQSDLSMNRKKRNVRKISDVNEGVVEGGEDAGNAENELACPMRKTS